MISSNAVIGITIGGVICFLTLLILLIYCSICCCCVLRVDNDQSYNISDVSFLIKNFRSNKLVQRKAYEEGTDLEKQQFAPEPATCCNLKTNTHASNTAIKSAPLKVPSKSKLESTSTFSNEYKDAYDNFDSVTDGLSRLRSFNVGKSNLTRRLSSIKAINTSDANKFSTIISEPSESEQAYLSDQYDSFSRTLMLQNLLENSINGSKSIIKKVRDPYSRNLISVGIICVVVRPFNGKESHEFTSLQTGDLLRIVKFYINEPEDSKRLNKSLILKSKLQSSEADDCEALESDMSTIKQTLNLMSTKNDVSDQFIDKDDPSYQNIICTAVILNTYLEYDGDSGTLALKFRIPSSLSNPKSESELLKDVPLKVVSLETTVLKSMVDPSIEQVSISEKFK